MKGADAGGDVGARSATALAAGCDMVLVCNDPDGARRAADKLAGDYFCDQARLLSMKTKADTPPDSAALEKMAEALAGV